jgi:hypothetical protein
MSKNRGPVSVSVPAGGPPGYQAVGNLIAAYAELVDNGDFAGVGALLSDATFEGSGAPVSGADSIEQMLRNTVIVYADGTPRTRHVTTNVVIETDDEAAPRWRGRTSRCCRRCPAPRCSPSSAAGTGTASNVATGSGSSPNGAS